MNSLKLAAHEGEGRILSSLAMLWIVPLVVIPALPKVKILSIGSIVLLADDFALIFGVGLGLLYLITRASVTGSIGLSVLPVVVLYAGFIVFKAIDLGFLSLFYPWTDLGDLGKGIYFSEGILVLGKTTAMLCVYVLFYSQLRTRRSIYAVLKLNIICLLVVVAWGVFQYFGLGHKVLTSTFRNIHTLQANYSIFRVEDAWLDDASVGHEHLGAYMIIALSSLGSMLLLGWPEKRKGLVITLCIMCVFILVFAGSRGAWIGASCAAFALIWLALKHGSFGSLLLVVFAMVLLAWVAKSYQNIDVIAYIEGRVIKLLDIPYIPFGEVRDDSAKHRITQYRILWETFTTYPVLGLGPGGAGRIAEGQLIREMIEGGIVGTLIFIALIFKTGQLALRAYRSSAHLLTRGLSYGYLATLVGLAGQSFFTELLILTKIGVPFWLLGALVHRLYVIENGEERGNHIRPYRE